MQLRLLILVGWKKTETGLAPEQLYFGNDAVTMGTAASEAQKSGDFVAIREFRNPEGRPRPVMIDPAPTITKIEPIKTYQAPTTKTKTPAEEAHEKEKAALNDRQAAALEKDAVDMQIVREGKAFSDLALKSKSQLTEILEDLNSDLPKDQKVPVVPGAKKVDIINSILVAQGVKKPVVPNETNKK